MSAEKGYTFEKEKSPEKNLYMFRISEEQAKISPEAQRLLGLGVDILFLSEKYSGNKPSIPKDFDNGNIASVSVKKSPVFDLNEHGDKYKINCYAADFMLDCFMNPDEEGTIIAPEKISIRTIQKQYESISLGDHIISIGIQRYQNPEKIEIKELLEKNLFFLDYKRIHKIFRGLESIEELKEQFKGLEFLLG